MVRHSLIKKQVLSTYRSLESISFPIKLDDVIRSIPRCRLLSYQELSDVTGFSVSTIKRTTGSKNGSSHFRGDDYLILYNDKMYPERQRWTIGHELGHIIMGHFQLAQKNIFSNTPNIETDIEREAEEFCAEMLSPLPSFSILNIQNELDIHYQFGLSLTASKIRWKTYIQWIETHTEQQYDRQLINLIRKNILH